VPSDPSTGRVVAAPAELREHPTGSWCMLYVVFAASAGALWERLVGLSQPVCLVFLADINSEL